MSMVWYTSIRMKQEREWEWCFSWDSRLSSDSCVISDSRLCWDSRLSWSLQDGSS